MIMKSVLSLFCLLVLSVCVAAKPEHSILKYYGESVDSLINLKDSELKAKLSEIISSYHISEQDSFDQISNTCPENRAADCSIHKPLTYNEARAFLFSDIFGETISKDEQGHSKVKVTEIYCGKSLIIDVDESNYKTKIPDHNQINVEHSWPRSRFVENDFSKRGDKESSAQKWSYKNTDLHHLFASDNKTNSMRAHYQYADVSEEEVTKKGQGECEKNKLKLVSGDIDQSFFEPVDEFKGDIARALFYFSTRYGLPIHEKEEAALKKWHKADPVSSFELLRNNQIQTFQGNRNPYVDLPELVDSISNF